MPHVPTPSLGTAFLRELILILSITICRKVSCHTGYCVGHHFGPLYL